MTLAYALIVTCVTTALLWLGPEVQGRVISHASTNLHNLSHGRLGTLLGSAFVVDAGPIKVTADQQHTIPIPSIAGVIAILAGAGMVFFGRRGVKA